MWKKSRQWHVWHRYGEMEGFPSVTVIIPAYNEEKTIFRKLKNLLEQDYPNIEVIIVNDGSNDSTGKMVQSFIANNSGSRYNFQLINLPHRGGKASALNHAFSHSKGEIVVVSDADTILGQNAIKQLVKSFHDPKVGAVTGKLSMINYEESSSTKLEESYRNIFDTLRLGESLMDSTPVFNGALLALRNNLYENLKSDTLADDTEISLKIREKGYKAIFIPTATVFAFTPKSFKFRMKQKIRRAQGIIQAMIRHRKIMFNPEYGNYGLIILPCEFFMHIVSPILVVLASTLFISIFATINMLPILTFSGLGLIVLSLMYYALRRLRKTRFSVDPIKIFMTFIEHQLFLFLGLLFILSKRGNAKWEKIND